MVEINEYRKELKSRIIDYAMGEFYKVVCAGGSCGEFLPQALSAGADAFITGEMHYHEYFDHDDEIQIAVIGHYESEQFTQQLLKRIIEKECPGVECHLTEVMTNPLRYF